LDFSVYEILPVALWPWGLQPLRDTTTHTTLHAWSVEGAYCFTSLQKGVTAQLSCDITAINFIQNVIQYNSLKVKFIHIWSYWGSSVWGSTSQISCWSDILHSSDTGENMGVKWHSTSAIHRLQESLWFSEEGSFVQYSHIVWGTHEATQAD
jgi:hypothetical protein